MTPLLLALAASAITTPARQTCAPFVDPSSITARQRDAGRVHLAYGHAVTAAQVHLAMAKGDWRLVWATPDDSEPGVWFFKRGPTGYRLVDTWGGVALDSERPEVTAWATKLGVPLPLAQCFAATGINEEEVK